MNIVHRKGRWLIAIACVIGISPLLLFHDLEYRDASPADRGLGKQLTSPDPVVDGSDRGSINPELGAEGSDFTESREAVSQGASDHVVVSGIVRNRYGGPPIPGFHLKLVAKAENQPASERNRTTDDRGEFSCEFPAPANRLEIQAVSVERGYVQWPSELVLTAESMTPERMVLVVYETDATASGMVRDQNGRGVAEATIEYMNSSASTNESGHYRIAVSSNENRSWLNVSATGFASQRKRIRLDGAGHEVVVNWQLTPEMLVKGRVLDEHGGSIGGATVSSSHGRGSVTTTDDGGFELGGIPQGDMISYVTASAQGFVRESVQLRRGGPHVHELIFQLARTRRVAGRVVDENGTPIAGAQVLDSMAVKTIDYSDHSGHFDAECAPDSTLQLVVAHPDYAPTEYSGAPNQEAVVVLEGGRRLKGVVVDQEGSGVQGAWIVTIDADGNDASRFSASFTHESGRFEIAHAPIETSGLAVFASDFQPTRIDLPAETSNVDSIVLKRGGGLRGVVTTAATGDPVEEFTIRVVESPGTPRPTWLEKYWSTEGTTFIDERGEWSIESSLVAPGDRVDVLVEAAGHSPMLHQNVVVETYSSPTVVLSSMLVGGSISGRVVSAQDSTPIANALLTWIGLDGKRSAGQQLVMAPASVFDISELDGRFTLVGLPEGDGQIVAESKGFATGAFGPLSAIRDPRDSSIVLLPLEKGTSIIGRSLGINREVTLSGGVGSQWGIGNRTTRSDDQGWFVFDHVSPGRYRMVHTVYRQGIECREYEGTRTVHGAEEHEWFDSSGDRSIVRLSLSGQVASADAVGVRFSRHADDGSSDSWSAIFESGYCELAGIPPGKYQCVLFATGKYARPVTCLPEHFVVLPGGASIVLSPGSH